MLKETIKTPYVAVFKLSSGEEFICKVTEETVDSYTVSKPLTIAQTPQGMQFVPIMILSDQNRNVTIPKPIIAGFPAPEVESQYESITTGIALPKKSAIISA
jgi:hypothetical protein